MDKSNAIDIRNRLLFVVAGFIVSATGALGWWHVIGHSEPKYVKAFRAIVIVCGLAVCVSAFVKSWRPRALTVAGLAAALLPMLMVQYIVTRDPLTMDLVDMQTRQANWLLICLNHTEDEPYVPWVEPTSVTPPTNRSNVSNIFDGFETVPVFAKGGWYGSMIIGWCTFALACLLYGASIRSDFVKYRKLFGIVVAASILYFYAGPFAGYVLWNEARAAAAQGDYARAIYDDEMIPTYDARWNYDMLYQNELGRMYGHLGLMREPYYWAFMTDTMVHSGRYRNALLIFRDHLAGSRIRGVDIRYQHLLILTGAQDFRNGRIGEANDLWRRAASLDQNDVEALYFEGFGLTKAGLYREAVPVWKSLIAENEGVGLYRLKYFANRKYRKQITSRAWGLLGWCYFQLNDYDAAVTCRGDAMQAGKTDVNAVPNTDAPTTAAYDPVDGADPTSITDVEE